MSHCSCETGSRSPAECELPGAPCCWRARSGARPGRQRTPGPGPLVWPTCLCSQPPVPICPCNAGPWPPHGAVASVLRGDPSASSRRTRGTPAPPPTPTAASCPCPHSTSSTCSSSEGGRGSPCCAVTRERQEPGERASPSLHGQATGRWFVLKGDQGTQAKSFHFL